MKSLIISILLLASPLFAADRYLLIGIDTDATNHDKLELLRVINKYLDPDYVASMAIYIEKISDPTKQAIIGCWDVGGRKFPFNKQQAQNYFANHAADFDNVNKIRLLFHDNPQQALSDAGWQQKSEK